MEDQTGTWTGVLLDSAFIRTGVYWAQTVARVLLRDFLVRLLFRGTG